MFYNRLICKAFIVITICLFMSLASSALAADLQRAQATMDRYLAAQAHWQDNLAALIIANKPEFKQNAIAQRDHQHALIALKRARFNYLVKHHPERLDSGELGRFTNFTWSATDTAAASQADPDYRGLEQAVSNTRAIYDQQPHKDAFRHYFQAEFAQSEDFQQELKRFQAQLEEISP
jgi:hypothetical protein